MILGRDEFDRRLGQHPVGRRGASQLLQIANGPETCWQKPMSPSNSGAGPVIPSRASMAAKTPLRAAWANAHPFHIDNSPALVSRLARRCQSSPAMPSRMNGFRVIELQQLRRRQAAEERHPYVAT